MMAKWQQRLEIAQHFEAARGDRSKIPDLVSEIARQLRHLQLQDDECIELASKFEALRETIDAEVATANPDWEGVIAEFDELMVCLYDWGDSIVSGNKRLCWIDTMGAA